MHDYSNEIDRLADFVELDFQNYKYEQKYFHPSKGKINLSSMILSLDLKRDISKIEGELNEFLNKL